MGANELSALLWTQRNLLDLVIFKLTEEQLLLIGGHNRWLQHATAEVEASMKRLRFAGLAVDVEVASVAKEWGIEGEPTLSELISGAPKEWEEILRSHRTATSSLVTQIKTLRDSNEQFLRTMIRSTQETLATIHPEVGTYDSHGVAGRASTASASLLDTQI